MRREAFAQLFADHFKWWQETPFICIAYDEALGGGGRGPWRIAHVGCDGPSALLVRRQKLRPAQARGFAHGIKVHSERAKFTTDSIRPTPP